ncbi:hypothetical protein [Microbaculum marinisediminis]|uniref:Uncharacterized protein n=1 Tax=Microbaculum marinisediminis TaxID=2931392 RepID=A0AAW5QUM9_9HYPH|nr:hypothetical protein [Microbaculum sp. A6E488]MCT8971199.1 hypothetical protein [Microbaculum sp. A6E488]
MNRNALIGLAAALFVALAGVAAATPGNALACSGGLGDNCAEIDAEFGTGANGPAGVAGVPVAGGPGLAVPVVPTPGPMRLAGGGCGAAAAQAAAAQGGQVIGAPRVVQRGNRTLCVVTVLIKDPSGRKPPTRKQITVPAN